MNFHGIIESTRECTRRAQDSYSDLNWRADRIKKPFRFYLNGDWRFNTQFRDQRTLLQRGTVVWGAIVQANKVLFEQGGSCASLPAAIIYSLDPVYDNDPDRLIEHAHNLYDLKGKSCTPEMQAFGDKLANEIVADIKLPIPKGFTDPAQCYYAMLLIARKHLPLNYLAHGFFPVLVAPEETDTVMILPQSYWDSEFKLAWSQS
ncbi:MAG: hypothetical protein GY880_04375 [Planctomycetaceae bacterium]|nr:hypothetical protein [Planctomycetaceae bacterium]MCP4477092.1 hypothetical protein [Planctomycetaceae bacterium]MCP4773453.1 hypothetical protein [Planctomycetaceae bacterium]MDG1513909.1 hypothetical protein [Mariniblastus sp.]